MSAICVITLVASCSIAAYLLGLYTSMGGATPKPLPTHFVQAFFGSFSEQVMQQASDELALKDSLIKSLAARVEIQSQLLAQAAERKPFVVTNSILEHDLYEILYGYTDRLSSIKRELAMNCEEELAKLEHAIVGNETKERRQRQIARIATENISGRNAKNYAQISGAVEQLASIGIKSDDAEVGGG